MFRFISFLFGKQYESCKSCEILKQQLEFVNSEKRDLLNTLLDIMKPQVYEATPKEIAPLAPKFTLWSKRRSALEESDRQQAKLKANSNYVAKPDSQTSSDYDDNVEELERELEIGGEK